MKVKCLNEVLTIMQDALCELDNFSKKVNRYVRQHNQESFIQSYTHESNDRVPLDSIDIRMVSVSLLKEDDPGRVDIYITIEKYMGRWRMLINMRYVIVDKEKREVFYQSIREHWDMSLIDIIGHHEKVVYSSYPIADCLNQEKIGESILSAATSALSVLKKMECDLDKAKNQQREQG